MIWEVTLEKIQLAILRNSSAKGVVTEKLGHIVHAVCPHFNTSFSLCDADNIPSQSTTIMLKVKGFATLLDPNVNTVCDNLVCQNRSSSSKFASARLLMMQTRCMVT